MDKDNNELPKVVETYSGHMSKALEEGSEGLLKDVIQKEELHDEEKKSVSPEMRKNRIFILLSLLVIAIAAGTLYYFLVVVEESYTVPVAPQIKPLIFLDSSTTINIAEKNKEEIIKLFLEETSRSKLKTGGIQGVSFSAGPQTIGLRQFLNMLKASFTPGDPLYVSDNFIVGIVNTGTTRDPFILLKVRSMVDAFPKMRNWEKKMFVDVGGFFVQDLGPEDSYLDTKNFEDSIVQNKNARILYDNNDKFVMMYVFLDDNSIVITDNEQTTREILVRLTQN